MKLIAESGSTKTDWVLLSNSDTTFFQTSGINPFYQEEEAIRAVFREVSTYCKEKTLSELHFYGAGCAFPKQKLMLKALLQSAFDATIIGIHSDLVGAARALCGNGDGIVCILGTGSNSCLYQNGEIVQNVSPLGYILGDEGSGATLGKLFLSDLLKNQLSNSLSEQFFEEQRITKEEILEHVYKQPFPNRFLGTFSQFLAKNINQKEIHQIVSRSFDDFFKRNVNQYNRSDLSIYFAGSIALAFEEILRTVCKQNGYKIGGLLKNPIEGLIKYHK